MDASRRKDFNSLAGYCNLQLRFASVDLELHTKYVPGEPELIYAVDQRVCKQTQVVPPLADDKFLCSFSHIFAGASSNIYQFFHIKTPPFYLFPRLQGSHEFLFLFPLGGYAAGYYSYKVCIFSQAIIFHFDLIMLQSCILDWLFVLQDLYYDGVK